MGQRADDTVGSIDTSTDEVDPDWRTENPDGQVEFITWDEMYGVIPTPDPAHKHLPDWYKDAPLEKDGSGTRSELGQSTVRRCIPFLEAMRMGWILKCPADISLTVDGDTFQYSWDLNAPEDIMGHFGQDHMGSHFPHEDPLLKFNSLWRVKVPDGYSVMFMPLANKLEEDRWENFFGLVDADKYRMSISAVVRWLAGDFDGVIERGTPICQVVPIKRDALLPEAKVRPETEAENREMEHQRNQRGAQQRVYRDEMWDPLDATRVDE